MNSATGICKTKSTPWTAFTSAWKKNWVPSSTRKPKSNKPHHSQRPSPTTLGTTTKKPKLTTKAKTEPSLTTDNDFKDLHKGDETKSGNEQSKTNGWMIPVIIVVVCFFALVVGIGLWCKFRRYPEGLYRTAQHSPGDSPLPKNKTTDTSKENGLEMRERISEDSSEPETKVDIPTENSEQTVEEEEALLENPDGTPRLPVKRTKGHCRRRSSSNTNGAGRSSGNKERKGHMVAQSGSTKSGSTVQSLNVTFYSIITDNFGQFLDKLRGRSLESLTEEPMKPSPTLKEVEEAQEECPYCKTEFGGDLLTEKIQGPIYDKIDRRLTKPEQCQAIYRWFVREDTPDICTITSGNNLLQRLMSEVPLLRLASFVFVLKQERRNNIVKLLCLELHKTEDGQSKLLANSEPNNALPECS